MERVDTMLLSMQNRFLTGLISQDGGGVVLGVGSQFSSEPRFLLHGYYDREVLSLVRRWRILDTTYLPTWVEFSRCLE